MPHEPALYELLRAMFDSMPMGIVFQDGEGRLLHANDAAHHILGRAFELQHARSPIDLEARVLREDGSQLPGDEHPAMVALRTGATVSGRMGVSNPHGGAPRWLEVTAVPIVAEGARTPHAVYAVFRDVTEARTHEQERVLLERRLRVHYEVGHVGLAVTSPSRGWVAVNDRLCEILGYTREELLSLSWEVMTHPEDLAKDLEQFQRVVAGEIDGYRIEKRFLRKDGGVVWIDLSVRCLRSPDGAVEEFVALLDDITPRKHQEERLLHSQKLEGLGRLAGGVAHDFNNLLSAVLVNAELALDALAPADPIRSDLEGIRAAGSRAASLTKQLLAFGRKQVLDPRPIDVASVISGFEPVLRRLVGDNVQLSILLDHSLPRVFADPGQLELVMMNLVVNGRDAMPQGGALTLSTVRGVLNGQPCLELIVSDTGQGMDEATLSRLFEPFFTTKPLGQGTGLGLSTAYGIVRQSGGEIAVQSKRGAGSTFCVRLPFVESTHDSDPPAGPSASRRGGSETLLVVEDDDAVRRIARRTLELVGYRVLSCASGAEALSTLQRHEGEVHLLLTDVMMPEMSGPELAERVRELRPELPVLFMSGFSEVALPPPYALDPRRHLVAKPFATAELARRVREALDG